MIDAFKGVINKRGGLAKATRFDVMFTLPNGISDDRGRDLTLLCETCQLPGKQITTMEYSLYGHTIKIPTNFIQEDVTCIFNVTNDYYAKRIFDTWQNRVISNETYNLGYDNAFKADVKIRQLNEQDEIMYTTILMGAYPLSVQAMPFDNGANEMTQKLSVSFCYNDYRSF